MNLNETIYSANHMIGVDEPGPRVREITLLALLDEVNALTNNDGTRIPQNEIDGINDIAVVWGYVDGEIVVQQIYNHETGEVYWEDYDENWSGYDEKAVEKCQNWGFVDAVKFDSVKGNQVGCVITRTFTWSEYDHVAMVLKFEKDPNEIFFVEAIKISNMLYLTADMY